MSRDRPCLETCKAGIFLRHFLKIRCRLARTLTVTVGHVFSPMDRVWLRIYISRYAIVFPLFTAPVEAVLQGLMSAPSSPALQSLHRLDRSSPDFQDQLYDILYGEEYKQHSSSLEHGDYVWLIDYLDRVRCPYRPLSSSAQAGVGSRKSGPFQPSFPEVSA